MRLNKYIAQTGYCSLREAETLIESGHVKMNGKIVYKNLLHKEGYVVKVKDQIVRLEDKPRIYIAYYKPRGIECVEDARNKDSFIHHLDLGERIFTIGRLDKDSEGLLLLTNDGSAVNPIIHSDFEHEKEYEVTIDYTLENQYVFHTLETGVRLEDKITKPCKISSDDFKTFRMVLKQGLNRQIRRMFGKYAYRVITLKRLRVMHIELGNLNPGEYRSLTEVELIPIRKIIQASKQIRPAGQR